MMSEYSTRPIDGLEDAPYKIHIDGQWELEDLYTFPRAYEQVYFLVFSLMEHHTPRIHDRISQAFIQYPWRGGYSAVNFYNKLKHSFRKAERPRVLSLKYASPGWIELAVVLLVAEKVGKIIKSIGTSLTEANRVYHEIYVGLQKRKLLRIEVEVRRLELEKSHAAFLEDNTKKMATLLGFENINELNKKTGSPLTTLKILLSLYRRIRTLAEYQKSGKTKF